MSSFFAGIAQEELRIRQFAARSPLFYRDVAVMGGFFSADLAQARALLPTARHRALALLPGRAVVGLHCLEYRDSDIGPYNEVSLAVGIAYGKGPRLDVLTLARALLTDRYHAYVATLPVSTEAALYGGIDVFGYPKYLAAIEFEEGARARTCRVRDAASGALILEARGAKLGTQRFAQDLPRQRLKTLALTTYPRKDGATLEAKLLVNLIERGLSLGRSHLELQLGAHAQAEVLRRLGLGRQLAYLYAPRCEAILFPPQVLDEK